MNRGEPADPSLPRERPAPDPNYKPVSRVTEAEWDALYGAPAAEKASEDR